MPLYTIRSERMLVEQLRYELLFRRSVGLWMNEEVWHATVFTKNRDRLLEADVARQFFGEIVRQAKQRGLMSSEHFSVDGTMVEAWASPKSFRPKREKPDENEPEGGGRNREVDFQGQRRSNETHESATDAEARLWRKSQTAEAKLSYLGHVLGENRHGLIVNVRVTRGYGRAEREAAVEMAREIPGGTKRVTVAFTDTAGFANLGVVNVLINDLLNGDYACYVAYSQPLGVMYLVNDQGPASGLSPGLVLGTSGTVSNSQCTVYGATSSASGSGKTLTLELDIGMKAPFAGNRVIYGAARTVAEVNSGWRAIGSWTVP